MIVNDEHILKGKGFTNSLDSLAMPRHRWYSYKEGFSPSLVEHALSNIKDFDKQKDVIIDPFNGSGTVTLFSSMRGYNSFGFEVNPFSAFISKVKELALTEQETKAFLNEKEKLYDQCLIGSISPLQNFSTFSETTKNKKWLFNSSVLSCFEGGNKYLSSIKNNKIKHLLRLALITSAMDNCNAKKDGKCLRYKSDWEKIGYNSDSFLTSLDWKISSIIEDLSNSNIQLRSQINNGDSRVLIGKKINGFKLCITSPPYLNSFDYTDIYRPELFLGNFIKSSEGLINLRKRTLRSHTNHNSSFDSKKTFGINYDKTLKSINESDFA